MYKKLVRTLIVVGVIGFIAYKAYEYFVKKDNEEVVDADFMDDGELELNDQESLADKIKAAAQKVLG
ncbi:MAG: hypothetical protein IJ471_06740 [Eubacterium sp.]|nr:hypothetical protein [Eubacterium sp.]